MAQASKTFRIFVSSTFNDLKEERNALQKNVFPKLRELCLQHGCRFQAIDLRWGVREEASLDQQTMRICREEIARCQRITPRPNFIVLLGDRYGWRPLPFEIPANEYEGIEEHISDVDKQLLNLWYKRDDNAVPPVYCLQPRTGEFKDSAKWNVIERKLHSILLQAIDKINLTDKERIKYTASATEQEIIQGLEAPDAKEHVFCFFRKTKNLPFNSSAKDYIDLDGNGNLDKDANKQLIDLKKRLKKSLPKNIYEYEAEWANNDTTKDHLAKLCDDVYNSLASIINKEISKFEEIDPLDKEITDHNNFGKDRVKFFIGRTDILQKISEYTKSSNNHPLAVFGESGSGKTALMAKAIEQVQKEYLEAKVIFRFIGATPGSTDIRSLLEGLCNQIYSAFNLEEQKQHKLNEIKGSDDESQKKRLLIEQEYTVSSEIQKLPETFRRFLTNIPSDRKFILFLDALDQLSATDNARSLFWLPAEISENARIIVSSLPGECLSILEKKLPKTNLIELKPMPLEEGNQLLGLWLKEANRTLQSNQWEEVLGKFKQNGLPLYLKLAFEEARRWKSFTPKIELSSDIPAIIRDLFKRLSSDSNHGEMIVSHSLGYLAAAKNGLTEDELIDVLSEDKEVFEDFKSRAKHTPPENRLPVIVWSRLYFDLEPYLIERSGDGTTLLSFYHRQMAEVTVQEYLTGDTKLARHRGLAKYFEKQPLWLGKNVASGPNKRKVSELPYQQTSAEMWQEIEQTLTNLLFVEAKVRAGMTFDLIIDYNTALEALPEAQESKQKEQEHQQRVKKYTEDLIAFAQGKISHLDIMPSVKPWTEEEIKKDTERIIKNPTLLDRIQTFSQFVNAESHHLSRFGSQPGFCLQQAYNYARTGPVAKMAEVIVNEGYNLPMLLRLNNCRPSYIPHPACLKTLQGHTDMVSTVAVTPDGHRVVSGSSDKTLRVWELATGTCLKTLEGHTDLVKAVAVTSDGHLAVSGSWDCTLRVWNLATGTCLKTLEEEHTGWVYAVAVTPDGRLAVSGGGDIISGADCALRVWDLATGNCLRILKGHTDTVSTVAVTSNGRLAVSGSLDQTLRVWDLAIGTCLKILKGHTDGVSAIALTPDGRRAVSGSTDKTLRVWDLATGNCLKILEGHIVMLSTVAVTPDGRLAVSGSSDTTMRVWDLETGTCLKILEGHSRGVRTIALTSDGRLAVSGSDDKTLRVWDLVTGNCLKILEGHTDGVYDIVVTSDGRLAISRSGEDTLRVWDLATGNCVAILPLLGIGVRSLNVSFYQILANMLNGPFEFFRLHVLSSIVQPPIITTVRLFHFVETDAPGHWDDKLSVVCKWCGKRFTVTKDMIGEETVCPLPNCGKPLKFNPFVVDNRDKYK
jgi:NACHT domain- and WD repeat-containing protein